MIKLLETNGLNSIAPTASSTTTTTTNSQPTLAFNKSKRSSSIDNVISTQLGDSSTVSSVGVNQHASNSTKILPNSTRQHNSKGQLNQAELSEILEKFNLSGLVSTKKEATGRHAASYGDVSSVANRSRSLQRDTVTDDDALSNHAINNNVSSYMDPSGLRQRKRQLIENTKSTIGSNRSENNNYSAYNNSGRCSPSKYTEEIAIILNQNGLSGVNGLSQLQSHVVPKPPPGNPQRNTNLYPAR